MFLLHTLCETHAPQIRAVPCMPVGGLQRWCQEKEISHLPSDPAQSPCTVGLLPFLTAGDIRENRYLGVADPMAFHLPCCFCYSPTPAFTSVKQICFLLHSVQLRKSLSNTNMGCWHSEKLVPSYVDKWSGKASLLKSFSTLILTEQCRLTIFLFSSLVNKLF